eukprot:TRINITY_DN4565_c1_g1_i2.p1 TRINITY_DN4565_c1_g1~~TRINITY_DN4565_c1_g1_i2.p1  ORF type:complete len:120 (+),score=50.30 TRINITY_DN4565_c1_g1_i2:38-397(+)
MSTSPDEPRENSVSKRKRDLHFTPMYIALRDGQIKEFHQLLIDPKAQSHVNEKNGTKEETVLHLACSRGLQVEVNLMFQLENLNLNVEDNTGQTPLNVSDAGNFPEISKMLKIILAKLL